jgi:hypothetical protein
MVVFGPEPFFPNGPGRFGGPAAPGKPGRRGNQGLQPGISPFPVDPLGAFPVGTDDDLVTGGDTACEGFPKPGRFPFAEPLNIPYAEPQQNSGIDLVDILTAWSAGPGETYFSPFTDGSAKSGGIHCGKDRRGLSPLPV